MMLDMRGLLIVGALCLSACSGQNFPAGPSPTLAVSLQARLTLGCSGQSNADFLCRDTGALPQLANVVGWQHGAMWIACWDEQPAPDAHPPADWGPRSVGYCWPQLQPTLSQRMDAFIWWQGEYDANDNPAPGYYTAKLADLMARIRAANGNPTLLIVVVQINATTYAGNTVQTELAAWARTDPHALYIPTVGLAYPDGAHMTDDYDHPGLSPGYQDVARRIDQAVRAKRP